MFCFEKKMPLYICPMQITAGVVLFAVSHKYTAKSLLHTTKQNFTMCYIFTVCTHRKKVVCNVPDRKHRTNYRTHGKEPDFGIEFSYVGVAPHNYTLISNLIESYVYPFICPKHTGLVCNKGINTILNDLFELIKNIVQTFFLKRILFR